MSRFSRLAVLWFALVALVTGTAAADSQKSAVDFLKAKQVELNALLKDEKKPNGEQNIEKAFDAVLDYEKLGRESLNAHWDKLTPEERAEFQGVLRQLVRNAYRRNLRKTLDYEVTYKSEKKSADQQSTQVSTTASKANEAVQVEYVLHQVNGGWRIYDIVTEKVSLVSTYRSQFNRIIKKDGFRGLMDRMKKKLAKGDKAD